VLQFICDGFSSGMYVTQCEVLFFVEHCFHKIVAYGWLSSFLDCWLSQIACRGFIARTIEIADPVQIRERIDCTASEFCSLSAKWTDVQSGSSQGRRRRITQLTVRYAITPCSAASSLRKMHMRISLFAPVIRWKRFGTNPE
jgi:hypothetical protein